MIDYEAEYDNRALVPDSTAIADRWDREAMAYRGEARRARRADLGLSYGTTERQTIDLFHPLGEDRGALAMFIHGGYWRSREPSTFSHMARGLNAHGFTVAVVGYDLCPRVRLTEIVRQIRQACLFLWWRYGQRMLVSGSSAGAHLAACMVATDWSEVDASAPADLVPAGLALSGIYDLMPLLKTTINNDLRLDAEEAQRLSPIRWSVGADRALDIVVGGDESSEFRRQSRALADAWGTRGTAVTLTEVRGTNHFTVLDPLADPKSEMVARLVAHRGRLA